MPALPAAPTPLRVLRGALDLVDDALVDLCALRLGLARHIGAVKRRKGLPLRDDAAREAVVLPRHPARSPAWTGRRRRAGVDAPCCAKPVTCSVRMNASTARRLTMDQGALAAIAAKRRYRATAGAVRVRLARCVVPAFAAQGAGGPEPALRAAPAAAGPAGGAAEPCARLAPGGGKLASSTGAWWRSRWVISACAGPSRGATAACVRRPLVAPRPRPSAARRSTSCCSPVAWRTPTRCSSSVASAWKATPSSVSPCAICSTSCPGKTCHWAAHRAQSRRAPGPGAARAAAGSAHRGAHAGGAVPVAGIVAEAWRRLVRVDRLAPARDGGLVPSACGYRRTRSMPAAASASTSGARSQTVAPCTWTPLMTRKRWPSRVSRASAVGMGDAAEAAVVLGTSWRAR